MSWKGNMKEFGGGAVTFLSSDAECIMFVVVADPVLLESKYKGNVQERIGCPVVTDEGFVLYITGKRTARKLSKFEDRFEDSAFMVVRHGAEGDINSRYDVLILNDEAKTKQLFEIAKAEYKPTLLKEALADADEILKD